MSVSVYRGSEAQSPFAGNSVGNVTFMVGAEASNVINVGLQFKGQSLGDGTERCNLFAYLSDDANGDSIVAVAPSGGVAVGTDGLAIPLVAGKAWNITSEADGDVDLNITHVGAKTCYLIVVLPNGGTVKSGAITFSA